MSVEKLTILMIDDDPEDIALVGAMLSRVPVWSVDLVACTDAKAATGQVHQTRPDLILLDFHFGAISGSDVYASIREAGYTGPILLLSGCDRDRVASMVKAGLTDHLSKNTMSSLTLYHAITLALEKHNLPNRVDSSRQSSDRAATAAAPSDAVTSATPPRPR